MLAPVKMSRCPIVNNLRAPEGEVAPGTAKVRTDQFLPAGGTGIRFLFSNNYHVNWRTDFAWGKDNFTWSMGVGEAF